MTHNNDCPHFAGGSTRMRTFQDPRVSQYKLLRLQNATSCARAFTKLPTLAVVSHINDLPRPEKPKGLWKLFLRSPKPLESAGV